MCGGVGTGKSITSLAYFYESICGGEIRSDGSLLPVSRPVPLIIITTARKRDSLEWDEECARYDISKNGGEIPLQIDSWNNIEKYVGRKQCFFIFDEQRVVGSGAWVKSFTKIVKDNKWILLTATPGDNWSDYIPVFIANGFYRNRTEFLNRHAVYNRYSKYPKIDRYFDVVRLENFRRSITVNMEFQKHTIPHEEIRNVSYDRNLFKIVVRQRWNPYTNLPIQNISELGAVMRRVVNSHISRMKEVLRILEDYPRAVIFYNYDFELYALREIPQCNHDICIAEWNGKKHEPIPESERWVYLVQYNSGAEGWNCVQTNAMIFYSLSYSYRMMTQAMGRIDRLNTPFQDLYYFKLVSDSPIDRAISIALRNKKDFNEHRYFKNIGIEPF